MRNHLVAMISHTRRVCPVSHQTSPYRPPHPTDGALLFDDWLVLTGLIAAFVKWFLETFGVMVMRGNCIAIKVMDAAQYTTLTIANAGHRANSCLSGWCRRK
ncbi:hypothetical protein SARC_04670 [Sphaeroforma arctica JP610]|uniref:Uncharacterized protein n=1 Tax=Sphaeroforma arctica JP610 TaxID=667725 RepID=A0A0L0G1N1_9EUKA|nr:hypothetical protein SARC_04670 [Sphaeroforma arctica JP610]KNC83052.1 hypothetical protein SARC_04670 [Sphaeroforma arctica JP610]|eukprot:XP_014156954.1 hypothetical protein SARC_04670 [Sphaeroforma arctica JP610]